MTAIDKRLQEFCRALSAHSECTEDLRRALNDPDSKSLTRLVRAMKEELNVPLVWIVHLHEPTGSIRIFEYSRPYSHLMTGTPWKFRRQGDHIAYVIPSYRKRTSSVSGWLLVDRDEWEELDRTYGCELFAAFSTEAKAEEWARAHTSRK